MHKTQLLRPRMGFMQTESFLGKNSICRRVVQTPKVTRLKFWANMEDKVANMAKPTEQRKTANYVLHI